MGAKMRSGKYAKFFIYLVIVILINVAGLTLFFRLDLTENNMYSISEASRNAVSTLSEPLTIKVFFTKDLPAPYNQTERYLHDLLGEYAAYSNEYFNYKFYNVSPEGGDIGNETAENQKLARNYGIHPVQIQAIEEDEVKFKKAYMGLVMIHGDIIERIPTIKSTERLEYKLTTGIQKMNNKISALLALEDTIHVRLFLSSSLKSVAPYIQLNELSAVPEKLREIVEEMSAKNYGKLDFEYIDPSKVSVSSEEAERYNLLTLKWPGMAGGEVEPGQGTVGLIMEYGEKVVDVPLVRVLRLPLIGTRYQLADMKRLPEIMEDKLESLIDINEDLGYLAGHGTLDIAPTPSRPPGGGQGDGALRVFRSLAGEGYTIKDFDLKEGPIPEGFDCLVIARPMDDFSDWELFQIDQFLMKGNSIAFFMDVFKEQSPDNQMQQPQFNQPSYVKLRTGLERLLEHYGIRIKDSYVMDKNCYKQQVPSRYGGGERAIYFVPIIKSRFINQDLDVMKNIKGLVTVKVSPVQVDENKIRKAGLNAHLLFSSSEESWEMSGRINLNPMFIQPPSSEDEMGSRPLAYLVEGGFPSYFAGKPIPEKEPAEDKNSPPDAAVDRKLDLSKIEGQGEFLSKGRPGKIFVMGSSEMLKDNLLDEQGGSPNSTFVMNVLDVLNGREKIALLRSKELRFNPLEETTRKTKALVKTFNIAGLPVMVVLFGLLVWFRRHSRKKRIQLMFQK